MIRTLLTTSAIALVLSTGAIAQTTTTETPATTEAPATAPADAMAPADDAMAPASDSMAPASDAMAPAGDTAAPADTMGTLSTRTPMDISVGYSYGDGDVIASNVLGSPVYSSGADDAQEIGTVNDLVLSSDGQINAVVIGVGGFLGIGEKNVAVDFSELEYTMAADNTWRWVLPTTAEALETAPDFVWEDPNSVAMDSAMTSADPAMAPADPAMTPADPAMTPADPAMTPGTGVAPREGYAPIQREELTAENLIGATVIGPNGEDIANVGDLLLSGSGEIDAMLIDFGGFLGIGQKRVAVALDNIEFGVNDGGQIVVYSAFTQEQLDAQPAYDENTYATDPSQRMTTTM